MGLPSNSSVTELTRAGQLPPPGREWGWAQAPLLLDSPQAAQPGRWVLERVCQETGNGAATSHTWAQNCPSITLPVKQMQGPHSRRGSLEPISPQQKCPGILGPSFKPSQEQKASLTAILGKSVNVSIPHFDIVVQNNQVNTSQHFHVSSVLVRF